MLKLIQENFGVYLAAFIMWGFLMSFLYNMVKKSSTPNGDKTLMWMSLALFISYMMSDPLLNIALGYNILDSSFAYMIWAVSDLLILLIISLIARGRKVTLVPAKLYIFTGLLINTSLFLGMYYDINYAYTGDWWFWSFYTVTVNVMDIMMLIALFSNKDFLGLVRLYKGLTGQARLA
ncbi:MAG: hypothetical protein CMK63_09135 [Pseudoalteromonadaceae bacterium]|jgi:hypothetical protein|nr:hypothetical protein [Pseudoalteromonas sp.]MBU77144.1 hypothetical protein [Pseudoalteromonadaceae bacterium]TMO45420.1 hypothetical protein CWC25_06320 [Pseudoalteromonas sp. S4389]HCV05576.1 hypothetical protein [Pseudoalteromonas sp.]|tara:strand:+ start:2059 stop:2592 length:534 start_codon:yes stop_codon:yes gene_type:complete